MLSSLVFALVGGTVGSECELTVVSTYLASSFLNLLYRVVVSKHDGGVA